MESTLSVNKLKDLLVKNTTKMGDIKKIAKDIKKNHELAEDLWQTDEYQLRLLYTLIMDKKYITQDYLDEKIEDLSHYPEDEKNNILDWLFANQLMKSKKTMALLASWEDHILEEYRRLYWYYQARLRWTGKNPLDNSADLVAKITSKLATEEPSVQWMMNFTAGWIGTYEVEYRDQLSKLGEKVGLYKDHPVAKGCTPSYLPEFIRIESEKREK